MLLHPIVGRSDGLIISASQRQFRDQTLQTRPRSGPLLAGGRSCAGTNMHAIEFSSVPAQIMIG
jgi:hypothetical protein